jgi:putative ABC transport system permease protein
MTAENKPAPGDGPRRGVGWRFFSPRRIRQEVDEEIRFHIQMTERELTSAGLGEREAREEALRRFGDLEVTRRDCVQSDQRRARRWERRETLHETWRDIVVALRQLAKRPAFAAAAVTTLALGIGANTTIFSAADHVLFRPLPYEDIGRVVTLWETDRSLAGVREEVAAANFIDWSERNGTFEAMGLAEPFGYDLTDQRPPVSVQAYLVTEEWMDALGVQLALGRGFTPEEYAVDGPFVVLIPHAMWQTRFASDPDIVGKTFELNNAQATIVGVLPQGLAYPEDEDGLWSPKKWRMQGTYDERTERSGGYMWAAGRIAQGNSLDDARADLQRVAESMSADFPETNRGRGVDLVPLRDHVLGDVRSALLVLLAAVGFVLLIACGNVASLILARASERERELAVRAALGAGRSRITRQILTESFVLAVLGGAAGVALAAGGAKVVASMAPAGIPRMEQVALDGRVLAFAVVLTLASTLLFGLAPALRFSRPRLASQLAGGRASPGLALHSRMQRTLVVGQIALALVLLVGAGLLGRSFLRLTAIDPGFTTEGRASIQVFLYDLFPTIPQREQAVVELSTRMASIPGVEQVAVASALPFHPTQIDPEDALIIEGVPVLAGQRQPTVYTLVASPGYFPLMGIPILRGRDFADTDRRESPRVAIINETLARRHFPSEDPIGKRVTIGVMSRPEAREIVGVVRDVRPLGLDVAPRPELFVPWAQNLTGSVTFVVATEGNPAAVLPALREEVARVNAEQAVYHTGTVAEMIADTLVPMRFNLVLLGALSLAALALAAIGIYGLMSYLTTRRTPEIGLRMALGAERGEVVRLVVTQGLRLALPGVALGVLGALLLTRFLESLLRAGVEPTDPLTFVEISALMLGVAVLATWLPARRAAGVDPSDALRGD